MSNEQRSDLVGQRNQRLHKIQKLRELGIDPYPKSGERTHRNQEIIDNYDQLEGEVVKVVGRVMSWREHGELKFADLQDTSGTLQLYIKDDELVNDSDDLLNSEQLELLDIADHIQAEGEVTKTKTGEISVLIHRIKILSKAIRPLPNKWEGLKDKEERFRRRYLDMTMSPEVRERFKRRAEFWRHVRDYMDNHQFHEVNIPVLEHTTGGADAKPFETYYNAMGEKFYLRISHELPLKRLLGAGFERVYDIGPRFRNEGFSDEHLPEHIAMEWYWAYVDYEEAIEFTMELYRYVIQKTFGTLEFEHNGEKLNLADQWERIDFATVIEDRFGVNIFEDDVETLISVYNKNGGEADLEMNRSRVSDGLWKLIRKDIVGPAFLTGVPKFLSPLSKTNSDDPRKTNRFQPVLLGSEMANAFAELNDPVDQLDRFLEQQRLREGGDDEAHMLDVDYIEMLEYGMPPAVGFGLSERVFWSFEGVSAREGVPFPPIKRYFDNSTKKVYDGKIDFAKLERHHRERKTTAEGESLDGQQKMAMVLNKDLEGWKITNTVSHIAAYLGSRVGSGLTSRENFTLEEDVQIPANSQYPIISLSGKPGQMLNFAEKVMESGLHYIVFTDSMIEIDTDLELQKFLLDKKIDEVKIWGVGLFGPQEDIDQLTKKFSLWK